MIPVDLTDKTDSQFIYKTKLHYIYGLLRSNWNRTKTIGMENEKNTEQDTRQSGRWRYANPCHGKKLGECWYCEV